MDCRISQRFSVEYEFPILFTRKAFDPTSDVLARVFRSAGEHRHRAMLAVDADVLAAQPGLSARITEYADHHRGLIDFVSPPFVVRGGEICKNSPVEVERIQALIEKHHLCRQSFVLAVGGGAVLDAVGFAAATAHRGVRLIRMPTTVLAQNDAGVGVKNGINAFGRKNFLGTFAPPFAVVNDFDFIDMLPDREKRSGIAEAVKVALIKDREFFGFLYEQRANLRRFEAQAMERMIIRCAELHIRHIGTGGDPFEFGSARPLDYGHWAAHKLEEITEGSLRHGEAVAIGIALDSIYSHRVGRISELDLRRILSTLEGIGFTLYHWALQWMDVDRALREFQEHLGGELTITLLKGIGEKEEVHEISAELVKQCVDELAARQTRREESRDGRTNLPHEGAGGAGRGVS